MICEEYQYYPLVFRRLLLKPQILEPQLNLITSYDDSEERFSVEWEEAAEHLLAEWEEDLLQVVKKVHGAVNVEQAVQVWVVESQYEMNQLFHQTGNNAKWISVLTISILQDLLSLDSYVDVVLVSSAVLDVFYFGAVSDTEILYSLAELKVAVARPDVTQDYLVSVGLLVKVQRMLQARKVVHQEEEVQKKMKVTRLVSLQQELQ